MLPARLIDYALGEDGGTIAPHWLGPSDELWLAELVRQIDGASGRSSMDVDERILEIVGFRARAFGIARRVVEAVWTVEKRRWNTVIDAPIAPEALRKLVFDLAAERSREEALAMAAGELGLPQRTILEKLFADRMRERVLVAPDEMPKPRTLIGAYNLALAQSLVVRSTEITARVNVADGARIVRVAKERGLLGTIEDDPMGVRVTVSGPLTLFHDTLKYGRALAQWFAAVVSSSDWSVDANVRIDERNAKLVLDTRAPIAFEHAAAFEPESRILVHLARDLRKLGSPWRIEESDGFVRAGGRLHFPDFVLARPAGRVKIEIVGFWTPEWLEAKSDAAGPAVLLCVDERGGRGDIPLRANILPFTKRLDAQALALRSDQVCARLKTASDEDFRAGTTM